MDVQNKNKVKTRLYQMFQGKIDKDIIDVVLQTCNYDGDLAYASLIEMAGDSLDIHPPSPSKNDSTHDHQHHRNVERNSLLRETVETDSPRVADYDLRYHAGHTENINKTYEKEVINSRSVANQPHKKYAYDQPEVLRSPSEFRAGVSNQTSHAPQTSYQNISSYQSYSHGTSPQLSYQKTSNDSDYGYSNSSTSNNGGYGSTSTHSPVQRYSSSQYPAVSETNPRDMDERYKHVHVDKGVVTQDVTRLWLILMRGLPGCGKSFKARQLKGDKGVILSADDYFIDDRGRYRFDGTDISNAHLWNQRKAEDAIRKRKSPIIIDNTNIEVWQMKPYVSMSLRANYLVDVVEPDTPWAWKPSELARRNQHGVSKEVIERMMSKYEHVTVETLMRSVRQHNNRTLAADNKSGIDDNRMSAPSMTHPNQPEIYRTQNTATPDANQIHHTMDYVRNHPVSSHDNVGDMYFRDRDTAHKSKVSADYLSAQNKRLLANIGSPVSSTNANTTSHNSILSAQGDIHADDVDGSKRENFQQPSSSNKVQDFEELNAKLQRYKVDSTSNSPGCASGTTDKCTKGSGDQLDSPYGSKDKDDVIVKNSSGVTLTSKQVKIRENLHNQFSHVDKEALDQVLESCSYNYEAASNFVRCSAPPPRSTRKKKTTKSSSNLSTPKSNPAESLTEVQTVNLIIHDEHDKSDIASALSDAAGGFVEPPNVLRKTTDYLKPRDDTLLHGKIDNIVESYKNEKSKLEVIEIDDCESRSTSTTPSTSTSYTDDINKFTEYNLQFIYECYPDFPKKYCKKWLQRYSGDLVKTCDYLSRLSQVDDLPVDVEVSDDDDDVDDGDFEMVDLTFLTDDEDEAGPSTTTTSTISTNEPSRKKKKNPLGGMYLGDEDETSDTMTLAMDKSLCIELKKQFDDHANVNDDDLQNEDLVFKLDKNIAKLLYNAWNSSLTERKRKHDFLEEDEKFARRLQEAEDGAVEPSSHKNARDETDRRPKGKKVKGSKLDLTPKKGEFIQIPSSPWKRADDENEITTIEDLSGKKLTKKQVHARKSLYGMFPGVHEDSLDQILESTSYNLEAASTLVTQSTGAERNTDFDVSTESGWKVVMSPPRKKLNDSRTPKVGPTGPDIAGFQSLREDNQSYQDYRAEAAIHANLRREYFQKAAEAFQAKNGQAAQYYADKGREHTIMMKEAHFRAAELTLLRRNKDYLQEKKIIDLHGLHVDEAVRALRNFLDNAANTEHRSVKVITGRGNHSKCGFSTVRRAIMRYLDQNNYEFQQECNGGAFIITIPRHK